MLPEKRVFHETSIYEGLVLDFEGLKGLTNAKKYNEFNIKIKKLQLKTLLQSS